MVALKTADIRNEFKKVSDMVHTGEKVLISRPRNENLVILSEKEYNELERIRKNSKYLAKIDASIEQVNQGRTVTKSMEELEDMAK